MTFETLLVEQHDTVVLVTLNRPTALNALNGQLLAEMSALIAGVAADAGLRVLVLTGSAIERSAPAPTLPNWPSLDAEAGPGTLPPAARLSSEHSSGSVSRRLPRSTGLRSVEAASWPWRARCVLPPTPRSSASPRWTWASFPAFGGSQRLARLVGRGRALDLLLGGHRIGAEEAERIGLINRVVPAADLKTEAMALAQTLAGKAPLAVRYLLDAVYAGADLPLEHALQLEATLFGLSASTADMKEGTRAFLEKRKPKFRGR